MSHFQKIAGIVGALLLGVSLSLLVENEARRKRASAARGKERPVDELAKDLQQAWAGYHNS